MSRSRAFFLEEAAECLAVLTASRPQEPRDASRLHAAARRLRGSAQTARYGAVAEVARRLELRLRRLAREPGGWSAGTADAIVRDAAEVEAAVRAVKEGTMQPDARATMSTEWHDEDPEGEIPITDLEYSPDAALARALELRTPLEDAIVAEETVGPLLDEIFDLIRLGMR